MVLGIVIGFIAGTFVGILVASFMWTAKDADEN